MVAETKTLFQDSGQPASSQGRARLKLSENIVAGMVALADTSVLIATAVGVFLLYLDPSIVDTSIYALAVALTTLVILQALKRGGLYGIDRIVAQRSQLVRIAGACLVGFFALVAIAFLLKHSEALSRVWAVAWLTLSVLTIQLSRILIAQLISISAGRGLLTQRIMVYGADGIGGADLGRLFRNSKDQPWNEVIGIFDDRGDDRLPENLSSEIVGGLDGLLERARAEQVDRIVVALPWSGPNQRIDSILQHLCVLPAKVDLVIHDEIARYLKHDLVTQCGIPTLRIQDRPISDWGALSKRIFDLTVASSILLLAWPLFLLVGLAVKLDSPGPVFFRQNRYGFNDELIPVWKFRTMYTHQTDQNADRLVSRGDPRITRIGNFLRRTSLDELPQLFNVFTGAMSLVGPRPHATQAKADGRLYQDVIEGYAARHRVKPGLTGWAQVNGWRGETDTQEKIIKRVEHDLWYIANWSIWLDIKILFLTAFVVLKDENAY